MLRTAYHAALEQTRAGLLRIAALCVDSVRMAARALQRGDAPLAARVIAGGDAIETLARNVEAACIEMIWKQQPVANELREIAGMLQIVADLQRIGVYAVEISKNAIKLADDVKKPAAGEAGAMADIAVAMLADAVRAYDQRSIEIANAVIGRGDEIDELHRSAITKLGAEMEADSATVAAGTTLLFALANLERVGDRAQNIAWRTLDIYASSNSEA